MWKSEPKPSQNSSIFYLKLDMSSSIDGTYKLFKKDGEKIRIEEEGLLIMLDGIICLINQVNKSGECGKLAFDTTRNVLIWKRNREIYTFKKHLELEGITNAAEVKIPIKSLLQASELYKAVNGSYPLDCETMIEESYVELTEYITKRWYFECDFYGSRDNRRGRIKATSTDDMEDGAGKEITYNIETDKFYGYGVREFRYYD
tara:strand:+ start:1977 stop:2585 length:609 start_codon:yes stop_codon:yes gene_type:complete